MKSYVHSRAPINIALIKYWGKKDEQEVLPYQPSISLSLDVFETITIIKSSKGPFTCMINGQKDEEMRKQVMLFLKNFTNKDLKDITITTTNTGPTAAGLASSASGYAALAVAANAFFETNFSFTKLSEITRKGSGSAIRSLLPNCVKWDVDGFIYPIQWSFENAKMGIIIVSDKKKQISSRDAMKLSIQTSPIYDQWVHQSFLDAKQFEHFNNHHQFSELGLLIENNALLMHKVCETTVPKVQFLSHISYEIIKHIQHQRKQQLYEAYVTMDAGPNVKVLCLEKDMNLIKEDLKRLGFDIIWSNIDQRGAVILNEV